MFYDLLPNTLKHLLKKMIEASHIFSTNQNSAESGVAPAGGGGGGAQV